ncbi:sensor histidine kinase [Streptomyces sp. NPDC101225]|uniref:sensor histidine kinase n=1 Tax=Streptomyces sp. NPDC101225 TaxID=3366135 RepID=UPI00381C60E9
MRLNLRTRLGRLPFRTRLAAAISALFLLAGALLLAFVVLLARHGTAQHVQGLAVTYSTGTSAGDSSTFEPTRPTQPGAPPLSPRSDSAEIQKIDQSIQAVQNTALNQMILWSGIGLILMALLAGLAGRWLAGRALRPVASMTQAARRISEQNLHQRLALTGPDDELHQLADTFDSMLDRLEKSFASQRRFIANASHELKTPLAVQRTCLQVGLADPLPEHLTDVRDDLLATNCEAEQLIESLLLLARSHRGLDTAETIDLTTTTRLITAEYASQSRTAQVTMHLSADAPLTVPGDPVLLRHMLANLIRNAIQYNHTDGEVHVRVDERAVTIANTGPSIPVDRIPDLFEPFRRLTPDRTGSDGHGLGLSIAASIAEAHHATLTATPRATGGLVVHVTFPESPS